MGTLFTRLVYTVNWTIIASERMAGHLSAVWPHFHISVIWKHLVNSGFWGKYCNTWAITSLFISYFVVTFPCMMRMDKYSKYCNVHRHGVTFYCTARPHNINPRMLLNVYAFRELVFNHALFVTSLSLSVNGVFIWTDLLSTIFYKATKLHSLICMLSKQYS
jgi:hypothetical protein